MRLNEFIKEIEDIMNQKPKLNLSMAKNTKIVCLGYLKRGEITTMLVDKKTEGEIFLIYTYPNTKIDIKAIDVTKSKKYIEALDSEKIDMSLIPKNLYTELFIEAILFFGSFIKPYTDKNIKDKNVVFQLLNAVYYISLFYEKPIETSVESLPIINEVFYAQARLIIKKYIKHRLGKAYNKTNEKNSDKTESEFDSILISQLKKFFYNYTAVADDHNLDMFIQKNKIGNEDCLR
ncbi:MAG: hypothetical protein DBX47_07600 [Clostridiales bacterium]|nr:MAG: hypothetical protein DBX47_07600 [Clostridiales bacterium]